MARETGVQSLVESYQRLGVVAIEKSTFVKFTFFLLLMFFVVFILFYLFVCLFFLGGCLFWEGLPISLSLLLYFYRHNLSVCSSAYLSKSVCSAIHLSINLFINYILFIRSHSLSNKLIKFNIIRFFFFSCPASYILLTIKLAVK